LNHQQATLNHLRRQLVWVRVKRAINSKEVGAVKGPNRLA